MSARMHNPFIGALAGALFAGIVCAEPPPSTLTLSGSIAGLVSDSGGVPQMGATVFLYNRFDRLLSKSLSSEKGAFTFTSLVPDVYTIRVSMASFLPALKRNVEVQAGMQSLLSVNLTSVFSSIEVVALAPGRNPVMSDEWKWVLRSASATRPILRMFPGASPAAHRSASVFSGTRGLVRVSAGDQALSSSLGNEADLGTAFALATSFLGNNKLQVSGNLGYSANSGTPSAAFRTSYRRELPGGSSPEVQLTMRQVALRPGAGAANFAGPDQSAPVLRSISAQFLNDTKLTDNARLEYGSSIDVVSFLQTLNYFSPYARLTLEGNNEMLQVAYSSGTPPAELFMNEGGSAVELQQDVSALALFPRVSIADGRARVQRTQSIEAGYRKTVGSRTYSVGMHRETVNNTAVTVLGVAGIQPGSDLLPDLFSRSYVLNAGRHKNSGYVAAVTQSLGRNLDATIAWSTGEALTTKQSDVLLLAELRQAVTAKRRHSMTARISGTVPPSGTQFVTSYQWANVDSLTAPHLYMTQRVREGLGLNVRVRQPIPYLGRRIEAVADLRNLLAQGYMPLNSAGRRVMMVHTPRSVRGGLSFIF
ncbi:MAG TPA: carboxypeptidase-like regulatory domain-containing protein [Bryobacteraceae bacterium]|nr:carboxypeptidase-like regulatory domain-containing protein [Bryobacteraceae bacterium]